MQDYAVDLAALPAYHGALSGLAIDLPESADGDQATIVEIRLDRGP